MTKKKKNPGKRGRRELFQENAVKAAEYMAYAGLTDEQIAGELGIATSTLYTWAKKYPELSEAIKRGKFVSDGRVIESLYKKATGYEYEELTLERLDPETLKKKLEEDPEAEEMIVTRKVKKFMAPDTTAIIYWLNNRRRGEWQNVNHIKHSGSIGGGNEEIEKQLENNPAAADALKELYRLRGSMGDAGKD